MADKLEKKNLFISGVIAGLLPHTFCVLFILFSVLGATAFSALLKPILLDKNFFYYLIAVSFVFATLSAALFLAKNEILSAAGVKRKWRYLALMYTSTILINLFLMFVVFRSSANFNSGRILSSTYRTEEVVLEVEIPCPGHAMVVTDDLKRINGIESVSFTLPNIFKISYDESKTTTEEILALDIFKTFKAKIIE